MTIEFELLRQGFDPAATPHLWVVLDSHSRIIRQVLFSFGDTAKDLIQELHRTSLRRELPTPLVTDNGSVPGAGRKGSQGDAER